MCIKMKNKLLAGSSLHRAGATAMLIGPVPVATTFRMGSAIAGYKDGEILPSAEAVVIVKMIVIDRVLP